VGVARRRRFVLVRMLAFAWVYAAMELAGVALAFCTWARDGRDPDRFVESNYRIQRWWSGALFSAARRLFALRVDGEGDELLDRGPLLILSRHTSLVDTLIPAALVANPHRIRLRYVLKKELLADPCLDIVGNRIPNHFVDRAQATLADLEAIRDLASDLGPNEGVVIYPEGTFFSRAKRARVLDRLRRNRSPLLARAESLRCVLPPRIGGVSALLDAAPEATVLLCAHEGLEGFSTLAELADGRIVGRTLRVAFLPADRGALPDDRRGRADWLYDVWARVDARARAAA